MLRPRRVVSRLLAIPFAALVAACATDRESVRACPSEGGDPPPRLESTAGVPLLMDIPGIGVLFRRRTVVR